MKPIRSHRKLERNVARLIRLATLTLAWIGMMLFSDQSAPANRRYIRQRYRWLKLDRIARVVRNLVIARAGLMLRKRAQRRIRFDHTPAGFVRVVRIESLLRALAGSELRKRLRHRDIGRRFALLVEALNTIDALARRLLRRLRRGLTRLRPILMRRPPAAPVCAVAPAPAIAFADSS